jgi:hypothetical protein
MGRELTWAQIGTWGEEIEALKTDDEKLAHPGAVWLTAVCDLGDAAPKAGEELTFGEAVDFPMRDFEYVN